MTRKQWSGTLLPAVLAASLLIGCDVSRVQREQEINRLHAYLDQQKQRLQIDPNRPLSMARCEELAVANSLDLRVRNMSLQLQDDQVRLAMVGALPRGSFAYDRSTRSNPALVKQYGFVAEMEDRTTERLSIQGMLPVLDWGLTYYSYQIAKDRRRQEELLVARAEQLLRRDVRVAYALHAGAIRQERLAGLAHQAAGQVLRVAKSLERAKMTVQADTALIEAALAQAALELSLASRRVQETHLSLSQFMSLPPGVRFVIDDALPDLPAPPTGPQVAALEDRALRARPELAVQDRQRDISAHAVRRDLAAFFPRVDLTGSFNWTSTSLLVNRDFFLGGFQVTHSLLDGGAAVFRFDVSRKTASIEKERSLLAYLGVLYDVELRALRVQEAHETVQASGVLERSRREGLNRVISLYKEGLEDEAGAARSLADLTIQSTALDRAQTDCLVAWYELEAAALPEAPLVPPPDGAASRPASRPASQSATTKGMTP
jgi:outer membrane protein TolC